MTSEMITPVEESIVGVVSRLGIERAHFAARGLNDWHGLGREASGSSCISHPGMPAWILTRWH